MSRTVIPLLMLLSFNAYAKDVLAVFAPTQKYVNTADLWMIDSLQGRINSNMKKYSQMETSDRAHVAEIQKYMKEAEDSLLYDDETILDAGKSLMANKLILGNIISQGLTYNITMNLTDAETKKIEATGTGIFTKQQIELGEAADKISYEILKQMNISLAKEVEDSLTKSRTTAPEEVLAQNSLAQGLVAERNGSQIEAMTYYYRAKSQDKSLSEANQLISKISTQAASGNLGSTAKNKVKLYNEWSSLLEAVVADANSNPPFQIVYTPNITLADLKPEDYKNNTCTLQMEYPVINFDENFLNILNVQKALKSVPDSQNWGDISNFPYSQAASYGWKTWIPKKNGNGKYLIFTVHIYDDQNKEITSKTPIYKLDMDGWGRSINAHVYGYLDEKDEWHTTYSDKGDFLSFKTSINAADSESYKIKIDNVNYIIDIYNEKGKSPVNISIIPVNKVFENLNASRIETVVSNTYVSISKINLTETETKLLENNNNQLKVGDKTFTLANELSDENLENLLIPFYDGKKLELSKEYNNYYVNNLKTEFARIKNSYFGKNGVLYNVETKYPVKNAHEYFTYKASAGLYMEIPFEHYNTFNFQNPKDKKILTRHLFSLLQAPITKTKYLMKVTFYTGRKKMAGLISEKTVRIFLKD